jgi:hypothetical protein
MVEQYGCDKRHNHAGPWYLIGVVLGALVIGVYTLAFVLNHRIDVIYDRVGEIQRQLECPPTELLVSDHEGNEYCFGVPED